MAFPFMLLFNIFVLVTQMPSLVYLTLQFLSKRKKFVLFLAICNSIMIITHVLAMLSLNFGVIDPMVGIRFVIGVFIIFSPMYILMMFVRFQTFREIFPTWCKCQGRVFTLRVSIAIAYSLNAVLMWPLLLFCINPAFLLQYQWMVNYHFIGWGIYEFLLLTSDLVLCVMSLRYVINLKREVGAWKTSESSLSSEQSCQFYGSILALFTLSVIDALSLFVGGTLIESFKERPIQICWKDSS
jgi:hypothetical protein